MTYYLNFREAAVGGAVISPYVLAGDGLVQPLTLRTVRFEEISGLVDGKNVLFATHGFNVSYSRGAAQLGQLEANLKLTGSELFFGVLWPGDFFIPAINYPFEGDVSIHCGKLLADFCQRWMKRAQSLSFASHSLGARLVLEAVKGLRGFGRARSVCLTAGAINRDCLSTEYAASTATSDAISVLASHKDLVLKVAFALGDPIADLLHDDHTPFQPALGYNGPPRPAPPPVFPWQILDRDNYDHSDYLPPGDGKQDPGAKWLRVAQFIANAYRGRPQTWPT
jgi:hypothetical protein